MKMDKELDKNKAVDGADDEVVSESRRKFIQAAGKVAVYTPPAMLLLSNPSSEAFARSAGGDDSARSRRAEKAAKRKAKRLAKKAARKAKRKARRKARRNAANT
jgi:hypothetical protein